MKNTVIAAIVITLAAAAIAVMWQSMAPGPGGATGEISSGDGAPVTGNPFADAVQASDAAPSAEALRRRIADLELALAGAVDMREAAEAALADSERDVAELEAYVDDIEARGEDPVDYADEGLVKFQRAFVRYEAAFAAFEEAEALEQVARDELRKARSSLAEQAGSE